MARTLVKNTRWLVAMAALMVVSSLLSPIGNNTLGNGGSTTPPLPPLDLDHFRCYPLISGPQPLIDQAVLQDQFDLRLDLDVLDAEDLPFLTFWVGHPESICNPVEKTLFKKLGIPTAPTPIIDETEHLTFYNIHRTLITDPVEWKVKIKNQFGEQELEVERARFLALPTFKMEEGSPDPEAELSLDHFKCYEAEGKEIERRATLRDQFVPGLDPTSEDPAQAVVVAEPKLFCNPTRKIIQGDGPGQGEGTGVSQPLAHLTCYEVEIRELDPPEEVALFDRTIVNQFAVDNPPIQAVGDGELLCVPTHKREFCQERGDDGHSFLPRTGGRDDDDDDDDDDGGGDDGFCRDGSSHDDDDD